MCTPNFCASGCCPILFRVLDLFAAVAPSGALPYGADKSRMWALTRARRDSALCSQYVHVTCHYPRLWWEGPQLHTAPTLPKCGWLELGWSSTLLSTTQPELEMAAALVAAALSVCLEDEPFEGRADCGWRLPGPFLRWLSLAEPILQWEL